MWLSQDAESAAQSLLAVSAASPRPASPARSEETAQASIDRVLVGFKILFGCYTIDHWSHSRRIGRRRDRSRGQRPQVCGRSSGGRSRPQKVSVLLFDNFWTARLTIEMIFSATDPPELHKQKLSGETIRRNPFQSTAGHIINKKLILFSRFGSRRRATFAEISECGAGTGHKYSSKGDHSLFKTNSNSWFW